MVAWSVIGWVTISPPKINSEISKIIARNFRDLQNFNTVPGIPKFPKFPIPKLCFGKVPSTRSGDFGNFGICGKFGNFGIEKIFNNPKFPKVRPYVFKKSRPLDLRILEFLEILEILDFFGNLEFLELIFRRADCDPSDDRPCTTTHLQWQGLSILMPIFRRISIYVYIYIYVMILLRILLPILILTLVIC